MLAAIEVYEMVSKDEKERHFILEMDQCWVLAGNEKLKAKVITQKLLHSSESI